MKNIFFSLFVVGLFLSLLFAGCEKDKPEIAKQPTIDVSIVSGEILVGDSILITLNWDIQNASVAYLDGKPLGSLKDSKEFYLSQRRVFFFRAKNDNGDEVTKTVSAQGPVFEAPTIEITANPNTLPIGGGTTAISWTTQNTDSVKYNGIWYPPTGSLEIQLSATQNLYFEAIGKGGIITSNPLEIYVLKIEDILSPLLCSGTWTSWSIESLDTLGNLIDLIWSWENAIPCDQDDEITFTMNPNVFRFDAGVQCGVIIPSPITLTWTLEDSVFVIGEYTKVHKIVLLTKDVFAYTYNSFILNGNGSFTPILIKNTYKHLP